jgi:hypothetical protein
MRLRSEREISLLRAETFKEKKKKVGKSGERPEEACM